MESAAKFCVVRDLQVKPCGLAAGDDDDDGEEEGYNGIVMIVFEW